MVFSSIIFIWLFLPLVFLGNLLCRKAAGNKGANILLLVASILFYAWGEPIHVLLMLVSISVNWTAGMLLERKNEWKKAILAITVLIDLVLLFHFKYSRMITETVNTALGTNLEVPEIKLPIGISFFTFQAMSYVIDVYRGECESQKSWCRLALYVSFFPQLIAGPIVKYRDISEQIAERTVTREKTAAGIRRFIYGLGKKVLLANVFALVADKIYALEISGVTGAMMWIASIAYMLQIYYDFSGYSDMAIGLGRIFGFEFRENFRYPYISHSIREFWRRWHISLSSWFRDYLYIPLGGNRKGKTRTYINLLVVFLCTGLWHGANWTFVLWGLYHGFFIVIERMWLGKRLDRHKWISLVYTLLIVNFGWVLFRADTIGAAIEYVKHMILPWQYRETEFLLRELLDDHTIFCLVIGGIGAGLLQKFAGKYGRMEKRWHGSVAEVVFCAAVLALSIISLASTTYNPFIYFRF